jgi:hypothetical protein
LAQGWPVFFAMAGLAIAGRDVVVTIAKVISIAAAIPVAANVKVRPIAFFFGIESSLRCAPSRACKIIQFCAEIR